MVTISIIMPLYNAEKYLPEALESVLKQTFEDFELICVDDASTDATMEIVKGFQQKDKRIKMIVNPEHSGAAVSRNKGLKKARGRYLTFLDGDDIFDEELLSLSYHKIEHNKADVVMYEYMHVPSEQIYEKKTILHDKQYIQRYCMTPFCIKDIHPAEFINFATSPCNKLYRRNLILDHNLEFQTLSSCNDTYFVLMVLLVARKVIILNNTRVLVYARDHFTLTRISYDRDPMCVYQAMRRLEEELIQREMLLTFFEYYYYRLFFELRSAMFVNKRIEKTKMFYNFLQKEGIQTIFELDGENYLKLDNSILKLLKNFQTQPFEEEWYRDLDWNLFYLKMHTYKIAPLFNNYHKQNKKIAVWGAGKKGKLLLNFLKESNINIEAVIDKDENKNGKECCGYIIQKPKDVLDKIQVVLASAHFIYQEIKNTLENRGLEVVDFTEIVSHLQDD